MTWIWLALGFLTGVIAGAIAVWHVLTGWVSMRRAPAGPRGCLAWTTGTPASESMVGDASQGTQPAPAPFPSPAIIVPGGVRIATRRAVVVGINDFGGDGSANLRGCVPDAQHVRARLLERGWLDRDIVMLLDREATKRAAQGATRSMLRVAVPDDHCLYFQSSHGSQQPDANGDEIDHLDEVLCFHGITTDWEGSAETDDEFGEILACAPAGALMTVALDLCHAATATRDIELGANRRVARYYARPGGLPEQRIVRHRFGRGWWGHARRTRSGCAVEVPDMNHRLLAACRDWQTSADADIDGPRGAFTHFLLAEESVHWRESAAGIVARVSEDLASAQFDQRPTVEGPTHLLDLPVFA